MQFRCWWSRSSSRFFYFCTAKSTSIMYIYIDIRFRTTIKEQNGLCSAGLALIVLLNIPCLLNKSICGRDRYFYSPMKTIVDIPIHLWYPPADLAKPMHSGIKLKYQINSRITVYTSTRFYKSGSTCRHTSLRKSGNCCAVNPGAQ